MSREEQVEKLTAYMANFIGYTAKVLPDDVIAKLDELAERTGPTQLSGYRSAPVLGKMRNSFSVNRRSGSSFERGCDPCNFSDTAPAQ